MGPREPQQGNRRTNRSQRGPVSVAVGQHGPFYLRVGAAQTLHMTVVVGAHWGATWAPEVHTRARTREVEVLPFAIFCRLAYGCSVYPAQPKSCTVHRNSHARTWNLSFSFACIFTLVTRKAVRLFGILSIEHICNTIN
jgi:hypothetical protein